jgi:glycogen synthase
MLQGCDAFVRPTTADGDSVSVREALALGVPCVASDVAPRPAGTVTFPSGDARALVEALSQALVAKPARAVSPDAGPVMLSLYEPARPTLDDLKEQLHAT